MANTSPGTAAVLRLEAASEAALAELQQLVVDSHWNQLPADWALFLSLGAVYAIHGNGRIVASGAVLPMGPSAGTAAGVSWISMILVTPSMRGRGLGRAVFACCLEHVQAEGRIPMLDATPQGEALYTQFGFQAGWRFSRWRRQATDVVSAPLPAEVPLGVLAHMDQQALGFGRGALLAGLAGREGARCVGHGRACALLRLGRTAVQIGPLNAADERDGAELLRAISATRQEMLIIDVPHGRMRMEAALQACGFAPERPFARMSRVGGLQLPPAETAIVQAVAGPEYA